MLQFRAIRTICSRRMTQQNGLYSERASETVNCQTFGEYVSSVFARKFTSAECFSSNIYYNRFMYSFGTHSCEISLRGISSKKKDETLEEQDHFVKIMNENLYV